MPSPTLKRALEDHPWRNPSSCTSATSRAHPEKLWQALTDPTFTDRYWGGGPSSDWKVGSPVLWRSTSGQPFKDHGQVVLEADPYRKLSYSWHNYRQEHAAMFGWTEEVMSELVKEQISKVTFELEPMGTSVKLTVVHDGFEGNTEMLKGISQGWPQILSRLKTLLETGDIGPWSGAERKEVAAE